MPNTLGVTTTLMMLADGGNIAWGSSDMSLAIARNADGVKYGNSKGVVGENGLSWCLRMEPMMDPRGLS